MRGAVVDVHGEHEEDDVGEDEERHKEREPPPERPERRRGRRRRAAPVLAVAAVVVAGAVAPVALALGPLLASPATAAAAGRHVNGDHRRLAPPPHGTAGGGGRVRVAGWNVGGGGAMNASERAARDSACREGRVARACCLVVEMVEGAGDAVATWVGKDGEEESPLILVFPYILGECLDLATLIMFSNLNLSYFRRHVPTEFPSLWSQQKSILLDAGVFSQFYTGSVSFLCDA